MKILIIDDELRAIVRNVLKEKRRAATQ